MINAITDKLLELLCFYKKNQKLKKFTFCLPFWRILLSAFLLFASASAFPDFCLLHENAAKIQESASKTPKQATQFLLAFCIIHATGGIMSLSIVHTRAALGVNAPPITIEVHISNGLPGLTMVGLPETTVKEARDRVRSAIINSGYEFPAKR